MLDSAGNETRGSLSMGTSFIQDKGCPITDLRPPQYIQAVQRPTTVKELLMIRRQRRNCSQDDITMEHKFKCPKTEAFPDDTSPHLWESSAPVNTNIISHFPPAAPENGHIIPQQVTHPALQAQATPNPEVKLTLFHWQLHQEEQRVGDISPEMLKRQDSDGDTCLHIAVAQGRRAMAYVLATKMAALGCLDTKEHNGQTALQIAVATNQHLIIQDLVTRGAQINTQDLWGRTPLHVCAEKGHFLSLQSIWRTLMGCGQQIDVDVYNYDGLTPLHVAVLSHNAVVKELRSLDNPCSYIKKELVQKRLKYVECMKTLLLMGASFGTKDLKSGRTCLHMASEEANVELLSLFFDQPSSMSVVNVRTFSGNTALHIVSSLQNHKNQVQAVKMLMRKGADPTTRNFENELPCQLVPDGPVGGKVRQILKGKYCHA